MRRVVVESPYAGDVEANVDYARRCLGDCIRRGESPIASHLLYTQPGVLDDGVPEERALGISDGYAWMAVADAVVVYQDRGLSSGVLAAIAPAEELGVRIEYRNLDGYSAA